MHTDARRQSPELQLQRRKRAVELHLRGVPKSDIVKETELSWPTVTSAIRRYEEGGESALVASPRGRKAGSGAALGHDQQARTLKLMRRTPLQLGLGSSLWSRDTVRDLIFRECAVELSERVAGNYLQKWGLVVKDGHLSPSERCEKPVRDWVRTSYPNLLEQASQQRWEVYWTNPSVRLRPEVWFPEGARAGQLWFISATTRKGKTLWRIIEGPFDGHRQVAFLRALLRESNRDQLVVIRHSTRAYASTNFLSLLRQKSLPITLFPETQGGEG
jgi:transposase